MNPIVGVISTDNCNGGALCYKSCDTCKEDNNCNSNDAHYLTRKQCEQMTQLFGRKFGVSASSTKDLTKRINTTSEWFDFNLIKAFDDECIHEPDYDGIRIYFARHYDSDSPYGKRDAFVIVTTKAVEGKPGLHLDYFYCSRAASYFQSFHFGGRATLNGQDNGELCPNNCNE